MAATMGSTTRYPRRHCAKIVNLNSYIGKGLMRILSALCTKEGGPFVVR